MDEGRGVRLQRAVYGVWLAVGLVALAWVGYRMLARPLAVIIAPILLAVLLVYLLNPLVTWLQRRGVPRLGGTALAYLAGLGIVATAVALVTPALARQLTDFAQSAPELGATLAGGIDQGLARIGLDLRLAEVTSEGVASEAQRFAQAEENRETLLAVLESLSGLALSLVHLVIVLLVGPVVAFYALWDLPRLSTFARGLVPPSHRLEVQSVADRLGAVVGGFVRGQLLIAGFVGVATSLGLWLIGLEFWLVIGIIAGITNLVPLIGPFFGGLVGVTVALLTSGPALAVAVVVVVLIVQQLDAQVLSPVVMGRTTRLHPLAVLLALLVAGTLYGIFGMIVAIPLVAVAKVLLLHVWTTRVPWAADATPPPSVTEPTSAPPDAGPDVKSPVPDRGDVPR
jgi:predicted PurR-regulated permease PerM